MTVKTSQDPEPEWVRDFCSEYTPFLFDAGWWMIVLAIVLGVALAAAAVAAEWRKGTQPTTEAVPAGGGSGAATAILEAAKGFIQALASAPTWLALFGGGVLLLWLAGNAIPDLCDPPVKRSGAQQQGGAGGSTTPPAQNEAPKQK